MRRSWAALVLLVPLASGNVTLLHTSSSGSFDPIGVEVPFGTTVPGTSLGANQTNASVSIAGSLLETTTDVLYLNNTNTTGAYYARLQVTQTNNLANMNLLTVGIDNGTATDQISILLGAIAEGNGSYVRLEPGSTNTVYVVQTLSALDPSGVDFTVYAADDEQETAYVTTKASVTLT